MGKDADTNKIIRAAEKIHADTIGTSTVHTTAIVRQKELETKLKEAGLRENFKTIVGGAPVTRRWKDKIGTDAYTVDAQDAVVKVNELLST